MTKKETKDVYKTEILEEYRINIKQNLLKNRVIFCYGVINQETSKEVNEKLLALTFEDKESPIFLYINSPGGSVTDGFSIIDTMMMVSCPIITVINGEACSMGGLISINGDVRVMTKNSWWMAHDMFGGACDYMEKAEIRMEWMKRLKTQLITKHLKKKTKLLKSDIDKAINKELWLDAKQCKRKGIVDKIIK